MSDSIPSQLHFPAIAGFSVGADFDAGAMPSDSGALLLGGADQQIGPLARLSRVIRDQRKKPLAWRGEFVKDSGEVFRFKEKPK